MTSFSRVLAETAPRIGPALSPLHFRYFCDKLAVSFCPRFYEYIFRCILTRFPLRLFGYSSVARPRVFAQYILPLNLLHAA